MVGHSPAMGTEWPLQQRWRWDKWVFTRKGVKWDLIPPTKISSR